MRYFFLQYTKYFCEKVPFYELIFRRQSIHVELCGAASGWFLPRLLFPAAIQPELKLIEINAPIDVHPVVPVHVDPFYKAVHDHLLRLIACAVVQLRPPDDGVVLPVQRGYERLPFVVSRLAPALRQRVRSALTHSGIEKNNSRRAFPPCGNHFHGLMLRSEFA